jgi:hypothetical protein
MIMRDLISVLIGSSSYVALVVNTIPDLIHAIELEVSVVGR